MKEFGWIAVIAGAVILEALTAPGTTLNGQGWKLSRSDARSASTHSISSTSSLGTARSSSEATDADQ